MSDITDSMDMNLIKLQDMVKDKETWHPWGRKELDTIEQLNRTEFNKI